MPHGKQYDDANRQAARCFTGLVEFRGSKASAGERWLRDRSRGAVSTGAHTTWNKMGNIQHMTLVARSLEG
ncbi:beta family protein [Streptomyces sp. NBC_01201]|uniref:beta family protein n=1 Tax=Streptomyces sp. NBC_01201 TaxID=2903770 RepID=UPI003FA39861